MALLNKQAYSVKKDSLIYDAKHPLDASAVQVTVTADTEGMIKRGQLLDSTDGVYSIHAEGGETAAIVAEDASYASDDTEITVIAYVSGSFRASEIIADPEIEAKDIEILREKGIYLK